jgi:crotonobetainyl-CoA:carnitine CoA-transferase CaiB-like acyl-CoA transferase
MDERLPLHGTRVLELGHIVAAPSGSLILGDLGADVIKVESPEGGDQSRSMPNKGGVFFFLNRNKRSIAINLKAPAGRDVFLKLIETADVVIDNFSPGVLDRLGIGYEVGSQINPGIIYCEVKGFVNGPYDRRPLLDELAQMMGGLAYMTGPVGQPLRAGASIVDIGAATYGVMGVLLALYDRERTGKGQHIKAGLFETVAFWVGQHMSVAAITGEEPIPFPSRGMNARMGWGVYHLFETGDGRQIFIAATSNAHWKRLCGEFELQDLFEDESLNTNSKRVEQRSRVIPRIQEAVGKCPLAELEERLNRSKIPFAPLNSPADLLEDPHLNAGGHLLEIEVSDGAKIKVPAIPISSDRFACRVRYKPPQLGEQSAEILTELGYGAIEIDDLINERVVSLASGLIFDK